MPPRRRTARSTTTARRLPKRLPPGRAKTPGWARVKAPSNREGGFHTGEILGPGKMLIPVRFRSDVKLNPNRVRDSRGVKAKPKTALDVAGVVAGRVIDRIVPRGKTRRFTQFRKPAPASPPSRSTLAARRAATIRRTSTTTRRRVPRGAQ